MRFRTRPSLLLACLWSALCLGSSASADVVAGDVIDETNWEKVEGMVPEPVLNYVKKGDLTIRVDDLAFDPGEYMTSYDKQSLESNKGKYGLNDEDVIIEVQSGKPPAFHRRHPFPRDRLERSEGRNQDRIQPLLPRLHTGEYRLAS